MSWRMTAAEISWRTKSSCIDSEIARNPRRIEILSLSMTNTRSCIFLRSLTSVSSWRRVRMSYWRLYSSNTLTTNIKIRGRGDCGSPSNFNPFVVPINSTVFVIVDVAPDANVVGRPVLRKHGTPSIHSHSISSITWATSIRLRASWTRRRRCISEYGMDMRKHRPLVIQ